MSVTSKSKSNPMSAIRLIPSSRESSSNRPVIHKEPQKEPFIFYPTDEKNITLKIGNKILTSENSRKLLDYKEHLQNQRDLQAGFFQILYEIKTNIASLAPESIQEQELPFKEEDFFTKDLCLSKVAKEAYKTLIDYKFPETINQKSIPIKVFRHAQLTFKLMQEKLENITKKYEEISRSDKIDPSLLRDLFLEQNDLCKLLKSQSLQLCKHLFDQKITIKNKFSALILYENISLYKKIDFNMKCIIDDTRFFHGIYARTEESKKLEILPDFPIKEDSLDDIDNDIRDLRKIQDCLQYKTNFTKEIHEKAKTFLIHTNSLQENLNKSLADHDVTLQEQVGVLKEDNRVYNDFKNQSLNLSDDLKEIEILRELVLHRLENVFDGGNNLNYYETVIKSFKQLNNKKKGSVQFKEKVEDILDKVNQYSQLLCITVKRLEEEIEQDNNNIHFKEKIARIAKLFGAKRAERENILDKVSEEIAIIMEDFKKDKPTIEAKADEKRQVTQSIKVVSPDSKHTIIHSFHHHEEKIHKELLTKWKGYFEEQFYREGAWQGDREEKVPLLRNFFPKTMNFTLSPKVVKSHLEKRHPEFLQKLSNQRKQNLEDAEGFSVNLPSDNAFTHNLTVMIARQLLDSETFMYKKASYKDPITSEIIHNPSIMCRTSFSKTAYYEKSHHIISAWALYEDDKKQSDKITLHLLSCYPDFEAFNPANFDAIKLSDFINKPQEEIKQENQPSSSASGVKVLNNSLARDARKKFESMQIESKKSSSLQNK